MLTLKPLEIKVLIPPLIMKQDPIVAVRANIFPPKRTLYYLMYMKRLLRSQAESTSDDWIVDLFSRLCRRRRRLGPPLRRRRGHHRQVPAATYGGGERC